ncbi:hypothetical protein HRH59_17970 [Rheinheimera sp. YQF-2]|uniref:Uncharacterized protein n=1 Tax=Rheinheimera lutimaris TaxID=2740584 RepID=A0A7Y5EJC3_9GAMM|nr:hypothetical protein [Rheinheimera lutimaris]NRQ44429.1 hypothetical protein [Rheinheimera lutimaris]
MENNNILQELKITELEERVEFGLCGGSGGGGDGGDGGFCNTPPFGDGTNCYPV